MTAPSTDVGTPVAVRGASPQAVLIDGERAVVWTGADGQRRAARDVCPHRRAPLSAGTVVDGALQCPYHGWTYDGTGRCTLVPAVGADGRVPPRARLQLLPVPDELVPAPPPGDGDRALAAAPGEPGGDWLDGDTPGLERFWHPVARLDELDAAGAAGLDVELLGRAWHLSAETAGAWAAVGPDGEAAWGVARHLDHVWLAPAAPLAPLPSVPEWTEAGWHRRRTTRAEGRYGVGLLLDNQLDAAHFAFVHTTTFGTPEAALLRPAEVVRDGTTVSSTMRVPIAAGNDPLARAGQRRLQQHRNMHYEFHAPLWLRLRLDYEDMGGSTLLLFAFTPLGAGRARMDVDVLFRHPDGFTDAQLDDRMTFEERVLGEDLELQRRFEDLRLPLEPTVELHTRADRLSLQCRQVLRELLAR